MRIAVIGRGNVGRALAPHLKAAGHEVVYGVRVSGASGAAEDGDIAAVTVAAAAADAEIVILAIMWNTVDDVLEQCGDLDGRILIDCINAYDFANNLAPLLPPGQSASTLIAARTKAAVVKCFNQVGAPVMAAAPTMTPRPLQFVAADDDAARATVIDLARAIGFDARDAGGLSFAADLEGMARLWIAQAFMRGMPTDSAWVLTA